ncbi:MAG: lysylphosphatidylglycerol synthase transmembrane domain-containing protein [Prevotellaceae bacterium]|nr:lysylphosphatidylglycerol synthase transmembrane domain-containing protein [Prevotellaceae bacterium]
MELKKVGNDIGKVMLSLTLGGAILYWMYRDFDFGRAREVMLNGMDWTWMLLSLPFGVAAQAFRGWRWSQTLEPLGEKPRSGVSLCAIFSSYAISLVVPRVGELARCGVLKRYEGISFPKALGTVVTERAIDSVVIAVVALTTFFCQFRIFDTFFVRTGTRMDTLLSSFTPAGWMVTVLCALVALGFFAYQLRQISIYNKVKHTVWQIGQGIASVKDVRNKPLFVTYTLAIWLSYFLHYYLTFFCFEATSALGADCALVTFIVGSIAVIVPTPNGAGPWHFAVKTMLILYGVAENDALYFVLIVHGVQTLLVALLGILAWTRLSFTTVQTKQTENR